jgi:RNA polymerase subunit RPABC4/transcription elongation factor Spt4
VQDKTEFGCVYALITWPVALLVVWIAAEAVSAATVGHDISGSGCNLVIGVSLVIATLFGRWIGNESASERANKEQKKRAKLQAKEAAEPEREARIAAVAAIVRKAELLGRNKLDWSEEKLLAQEEAQEKARQRVRCPMCKMEIDKGAMICPYCQTSFGKSYSCSRCRKEVDQYASMCPYCHTELR